jgi:hypothetical protein
VTEDLVRALSPATEMGGLLQPQLPICSTICRLAADSLREDMSSSQIKQSDAAAQTRRGHVAIRARLTAADASFNLGGED